jgi:acyl-CoA reductase-like NAD-dependent aldehyde dehydrogenase
MSKLQCISPIDGSLYVERELASASDIKVALAKAERAQQAWKHTPLAERVAIGRRAIAAFAAREDQLAEELCWMMGRPIRYAAGEIRGFVERASYMADIAESALADIRLPEKAGFTRFIRREPLGGPDHRALELSLPDCSERADASAAGR